MGTYVGTQDDFVEAINSLLELDYDAVEAYQAAINRLSSVDYRATLAEFMADHKRHIEELSSVITHHNFTPPSGPGMGKRWITKGKVVLANIMGDEAILKAMLSNELETNDAYETVSNRADQWDDAKIIVNRGLLDEKKHKEWLETTIDSMTTLY